MVNISAFMKPKDQVVSCMPDHSLRTALDLMVTRKVGSVMVLNKEKNLRPLGIITKTDMLEAYHKGMGLDDHTVEEIMHTTLTAVVDTMGRDAAAKILEKNQKHHAIVIDKEGTFVGVISSMDIANEVARDARAWPWIRPDEGKFTAAVDTPASPRGPIEQEGQQKKRSSFIQYIDNLEYLDM
ncbi:CBS [Seminavis robusta]|uniref:CBS n=1 Tax=Seminavis robusta TaxID=568900 RepID=A0A9N8DFL4_9STRA|nr:CBS [Seminavis robusta]|eukprot:Sro120_g058560.1 CBS (183) ;mRNA; f:73343-73891